MGYTLARNDNERSSTPYSGAGMQHKRTAPMNTLPSLKKCATNKKGR